MMMKPDVKPPTTTAAEMQTFTKTAPAVPVVALQQMQALGILLGQSAARMVGNSAATATVLPVAAIRMDTWGELFAIQAAIAGRYHELHKSWLQGWNEWMKEVAGLKRANTMSEYIEQQFNLIAQFGALFKRQGSDLVNLQENIDVDYGYWIAQKVSDRYRQPQV